MKKLSLFLSIVLIAFTLTSLVFGQGDDCQYLLDQGISKKMIKQLGDSTLLLNEIASQNSLTSEEVNNLVTTYIDNLDCEPVYKAKHKDSFEHIPTVPRPFNNEKNTETTSSGITATSYGQITWDENHGAHWIIKSNDGYRQGTGFATITFCKCNIK